MADERSMIGGVSDKRSPESSLRDHVERVQHSRSGRFAVQVHLPRLRPQNQQPHHIRIASRTFDTLLAGHDCQLYTLSSGDLILMCKDVRIEDVEYVIDKVRRLFQNDPTAKPGRAAGQDKFTSWYEFEVDYDKFAILVKEMAAAADRGFDTSEDASAGVGQGAGFAGQALDPFSLAKAVDSLNGLRITDMINRQAAVIIGGEGMERILFQEYFISMGALQRQIAPGFNLASNTWLFQHLTEEIDKRLLTALSTRDFGSLPNTMSINMNISTVMSRDFHPFEEAVAEHTNKVVIEFQQIDVFSDINQYRAARNYLYDRGYGVLIDGMDPISLRLFNPGDLDANFFKVAWGGVFTESESIEDRAETADLVESIGAERFILARTDSEDAIKWALGVGIRRFQGYFVDNLVQRQMKKDGGAADKKPATNAGAA